jgi:hypothetical protein
MLNLWLLSVRRRGNDPPDHFLTRLHLAFLGSEDLDAVLTHQTDYAPVADAQPQFLQVFSHPWASAALQAQAMLFADVGEKDPIISLPLAHWAYPPRTTPPRCELHDTAEKFDGPSVFPGVDVGEPSPLPGSALKCTRGGLWPANKPNGECCIHLPANGVPPFLARPSPCAVARRLCEGGCFPSQHPHAAQTSDRRAEVVEPPCSASRRHPPNPMKAAGAPHRY